MSKFSFMGRPRIGVTGPDKGGTVAWYLTKFAIWRAGGKAKRITPSSPYSVERLAGIVIGGGADIDPALYGEEHQEREKILDEIKRERSMLRSLFSALLYPLLFLIRKLLSTKVSMFGDHGRDRLERKLLADAMDRNLPILGICRGAQLINVHLGGSLFQDIRGFYVETPHLRTIFPRKKVTVTRGSRLHALLGADHSMVNALHYQAIKELGEGLQICARETSPDVVQAIEHRTRFILGVQWHPEYLFREQCQQIIFQELVLAAAVGGRKLANHANQHQAR
jgi:putative glutamine amidotransferase